MRVLVLTLALAGKASAASFVVHPHIHGAGTLNVSIGGSNVFACSQAPPVADSANETCPTLSIGTYNDMTLSITSTAAAGWTFAGFAGCTKTAATRVFARRLRDDRQDRHGRRGLRRPDKAHGQRHHVLIHADRRPVHGRTYIHDCNPGVTVQLAHLDD